MLRGFMDIDDHLMEVLIGAFKTAAKGRIVMPDLTVSEEVRIEDGIRSVIKVWEDHKPKKSFDMHAPMTNFNRYR